MRQPAVSVQPNNIYSTILLVFLLSAYCSCLYKVQAVAFNIHTVGTCCFIMTMHLELWPSCSDICCSLNTSSWSTENIVLTLNVSLWCLSSVSELSDVGALWAFFIFSWHTETYLRLHRGLWVVSCKMQLDVLGHTGITGILHFPYFVSLRTQSFSALLNRMAVWERSVTFVLLLLTKHFTSCFGCATEMTEWNWTHFHHSDWK